MKGILEFNLPDESDDFKMAQRAVNYSIAIDEFSNYLRRAIKYAVPNEGEHPEIFATRVNAYEELRSAFYQHLQDQGIDQ